jgi:hypothetical protein
LPCSTLYDVFVNIRDDEIEHRKTMVACQDGTIALDLGAVGGSGVANVCSEDVCDTEFE